MTRIDAVETPALIIDEAVALRNVRAYQDHCDAAGIALRPHIKTHKSIRFAKAQLAAGAAGVTCQKIGEAEIMARGGVDDILITYNILGAAKLARLRALADQVRALAVTADNAPVVEGLSAAFADAPRPLDVLVECDAGAGRCGVQSPDAAAALAARIAAAPGLRFGGLMTYPAAGGAAAVAAFMRAAIDLLAAQGLACPVVSSGGSPDMWSAEGGVVTEYRIGTYIFNDRSLVLRGACDWADCAATVLATVVSTPTPERAVIDAGSKALTTDLFGLTGYGHVLGRPEIRVTGLSEEHGVLAMDPADPLRVGDRIRIVPNHICVTVNMFDQAWLETGDGALAPLPIDARGAVT